MSKEEKKRREKIDQETHEVIIKALDGKDTDKLESLCQTVEDFPFGKDSFEVGRHWITNAIDLGSFEAVEWMIRKGVELNFRDDEGYTPIHSCLERQRADKYRILDLLIRSGADVNAHGFNDYTPLHKAALHDDKKSMRMLLEAGADRTIRTRIDDYATPEEEARNLGHRSSADFLASFD